LQPAKSCAPGAAGDATSSAAARIGSITDIAPGRAYSYASAIKRAGISKAARAKITGTPESFARWEPKDSVPGRTRLGNLSGAAGVAMVEAGLTGYGWSGNLALNDLEPELLPLIRRVVWKLQRIHVNVDGDGRVIQPVSTQEGGRPTMPPYPLWNCADVHAVNDLLRSSRKMGIKVPIGRGVVVHVLKGLRRGGTLASYEACEFCREILGSQGVEFSSGIEPIHAPPESNFPGAHVPHPFNNP